MESDIEQLNTELEEIDLEPNLKPADKEKRKQEISNGINERKNQINKIIHPVIEEVEFKKRQAAYEEKLANLKSVLSQTEEDVIIDEAQNYQEAQEKLETSYQESILELELEMENYAPNSREAKEIEAEIEELNEQMETQSKEFKETGHGVISPTTLGRSTIIINKEKALEIEGGNVDVAQHEFFHHVLRKTLSSSPAVSLALGNSLEVYLKNLDPKTIRNSEFRQRLRNYKDGSLQGEVISAEETMTLFSDAISNGELAFNENIFTKLGDMFRRAMSTLGVKATFEKPQDVFNFVRDYNRSFQKGKLSAGIIKTMREGAEITGQIEATVTGYETAITNLQQQARTEEHKLSKANAQRVRDIYATQGEAGAFEIAEEYRGMANKIYENYKNELPEDLRNMLDQDAKDIIISGILQASAKYVNDPSLKNRSVVGMVQDFEKEKHKYQNLAAYINQFIGRRALEEFKAFLPQAILQEPAPEKEIEVKKERPSLRVIFGFNNKMVGQVVAAVEKTFGTDLPAVTTPEFKTALENAFKTELKKPISDWLGGGSNYEAKHEKYYKDMFAIIPESVLLRFERLKTAEERIFTEPVINPETGKQAREATAQGNAIWKKKDNIKKSDWMSWYLPPLVTAEGKRSGLRGNRKITLSEEIGIEVAKDATMDVLKSPRVQERREFIAQKNNRQLAENDLDIIAAEIDRSKGYRFSGAWMRKLNPLQRGKVNQGLKPIKDVLKRVNLEDKKEVIQAVREVLSLKGKYRNFPIAEGTFTAKEITDIGNGIFKIVQQWSGINEIY